MLPTDFSLMEVAEWIMMYLCYYVCAIHVYLHNYTQVPSHIITGLGISILFLNSI